MSIIKLFPRALVACCALAFLNINVAAQADFSRPSQTTQTTAPGGEATLENDVFLVSEAAAHVPAATDIPQPTLFAPSILRFNQMMISAIDQRLGAPYVYGADGPRVFDCSGFVWSVFQSAGVSFERASARSFWSNFPPVREEEEYQFGTLVFFNNLKHVGIVADAGGFYHASTSEGVKYSPFNEYWSKRIDGFRRVPVPAAINAE